LTGKNNAWEIDIIVAYVIDNIYINFVFVTTVFVLSWGIITDYISFFIWSFIKYFCIDMKESPIF
jgi:hypothetical protein